MEKSGGSTNTDGFTIVELLIVIVIVGILAAITIVSYTGITNRATVATISTELTNISKIIRVDQVIGSAYPITLALANNGRGISPSSGTDYYYAADNNTNPQTFCLAITKRSLTYKVGSDGIISAGDCQNYGLIMNVDAGNNISYPGSGMTWTDISSGGHNCTLINGPTYNTDGGGSITFDGTNDYASCGTISPLSAYTIDTWVKMNALTGGNTDQLNYGYTIAATSSNYGTWLTVKGTEAYLRAFTTNTTGISTANAGLNPTDWFHIVATATKGGIAKVYVNGVEKSSFTADATVWAGTLTIGDLRPDRLIGFNGSIAKLTMYNRVQSDVEISNNFNNQKIRYGL